MAVESISGFGASTSSYPQIDPKVQHLVDLQTKITAFAIKAEQFCKSNRVDSIDNHLTELNRKFQSYASKETIQGGLDGIAKTINAIRELVLFCDPNESEERESTIIKNEYQDVMEMMGLLALVDDFELVQADFENVQPSIEIQDDLPNSSSRCNIM